MYIQIGIVSLMLVCISAAPIDDCNSATCNGVAITSPATQRTVPYSNNGNYFFTCSGNPVEKSKCLQCPTENQVYVERCNKCVAPVYKDTCTAEQATTSAPPLDKSCGTLSKDDTCAGKENKSYHLVGNNKKFYHCVEEVISKYCEICLHGTVFSNKCQKCVFYENLEKDCDKEDKNLGAGKCSDKQCVGKVDGDYEMAGSSGSNAYYSCGGKSGSCWEKSCPAKLVYSKACGKCLYKYTASSTECPDDSTVIASSVVTCPASACDGKDTGYYPKEGDASIYYSCRKKSLSASMNVYSCEAALSCAVGLKFNKEEDKCEY